MAEVKKIATRESYGNALVELEAEYPELVVRPRQAYLRKRMRTGILIVVLQNVI